MAKLIEILARELEQWPDYIDGFKAKYIIQDTLGSCWGFSKKPVSMDGSWLKDNDPLSSYLFLPDDDADDWQTAIVTEQEWRKA